MIEKLETIKALQFLTVFATKWDGRIFKGEKGENLVYDALRHVGYKIVSFPILKEGEVSIKRREEKSKEARFPDALAIYEGDGEPPFEHYFFLDPKYKSKEKFLGLVNKNCYDGYVSFLRDFTVQIHSKGITVKANLKLFFYLNDLKQIWFHNLRNPESEPNLESTIEIMEYGKKVYRIPRSELEPWKPVLIE